MNCTCPHIKIDSEVTQSKNWNPRCREHGLDSEWYNSPEQKERLSAQRQRTIAMQALAGRRRRGEISGEEARAEMKRLDEMENNER